MWFLLLWGMGLISSAIHFFIIGFPKNIVQQPTQADYRKYFIKLYWYYPIPLLFIIFAFSRSFFYYLRRRRFYKKNTMVAEYDAGEFSPMETAGIVYGNVRGKDLSATIINLAIGGYLTIEKVDDESLFKKTDKDTTNLDEKEKKLLEGIAGKKESDLEESKKKVNLDEKVVGEEVEELKSE